jgi:two-component system, OmpR family, response regulator MprA
MPTVLIVDDDVRLLEMLRRTLAYRGYRVAVATDGPDALRQVEATRPDAIILDWLLPGFDGIEVAARLREAGDDVPILMLTARDAVDDRVAGLDSGADDYLVKPFAPDELLARLRALLRRAPASRSDTPLTFADLRLDPATRETRRGERTFELTPTEFDLLRYLMANPRLVLSRQQLLESVWGYDFEGDDNVLEVYVGYLRRKTEAAGEARLIQTVRGVGYVLRTEG